MGTTDTPVADQLAKARADLAVATTAVKLATAKRARLAAEVRALEAEAEIESLRERAEAAEAALEQERAAHAEELARTEELAHAEAVARLKEAPAQKPRPARRATANGYDATEATPREAAGVGTAILAAMESSEPSGGAEPISDQRATRDSAPPRRE